MTDAATVQKTLDFALKHSICCRSDVVMSSCTSFRIGGPASVVVYPRNASEAAECVRFFGKGRYTVLGNGSNVLVPDEGLKLPLIKTDLMQQLSVKANILTAGAGVLLCKAANTAAESSLSGMEKLFGIPGSVGGAVVMNAGAYGGEMSQIAVRTEFVDGEGNIRTVEGKAHDFGYRHSCFRPGDVVCRVEMQLTAGEKEQIRSEMAALNAKRRSSQPLEYPSAGSVFKRPEGHFAGKLIEDCGLKGASVGGAQVSPKHAGFIVNTGSATAEDVKLLIEDIKRTVLERFGVELETEIRML